MFAEFVILIVVMITTLVLLFIGSFCINFTCNSGVLMMVVKSLKLQLFLTEVDIGVVFPLQACRSHCIW